MFGQLISNNLSLADYAFEFRGKEFVFNLLALDWILPGDSEEMESFMLTGLPSGWQSDTDGIVPSGSQRLNEVPGFSGGGKPLCQQDLDKIFHTDEPEQVLSIGRLLDAMANQSIATDVHAASSVSATSDQTGTPQAIGTLEKRADQISAELSQASSNEILQTLIAAYRSADNLSLNVANNSVGETSYTR